jgi:hypothetical protein
MFLSIKLNNTPVNIGAKLPETVNSLVIESFPGILIRTNQVPLVKQWLNSIVDKLTCEYVSFNGTLIKRINVKKFKL